MSEGFPLTSPGDGFDDHLGLCDADLTGVRLLVLHGASGSGKSTYLHYLLKNHSSFRGQSVTRVRGGPIDWSAIDRPEGDIVLVDELVRGRDIPFVARLLHRGYRVVAASHLHPVLTGFIGLRWNTRQFATDRDARKIERYLDGRGVRYSPKIVAAFCRAHGATYTDADIILSHVGGEDFDRAFLRFQRFCTLKRRPAAL